MSIFIDGVAIFRGISFEFDKVEDFSLTSVSDRTDFLLTIKMQQGSHLILESFCNEERLILLAIETELKEVIK